MAYRKIIEELDISEERYEKMKANIIATGEMIKFLGNSLVDKIDRDTLACQGLIRLSIKDHYRKTPSYLTVDQWISLLTANLINRLDKIRVDDSADIAKQVISEFMEYQSRL